MRQRLRSGVWTLLVSAGIAGCRSEPVRPVVHLVPDGVEETPLAVANVSRMGFVAPTPGEWSVRFKVPRGDASLWLAYAVPKADRDLGMAGRVAFRADLREATGISRPLLQQVVSCGQWIEQTVDLRPYEGRQVELVLRSEAATASERGIAYWATPIISTSVGGRSNVLLVSIDCLRADHVGCYGYARPTTPTIDSLAARGYLFRRAIAQSSWTLPSHASLLTSLYLKSHGVGTSRDALSSQALTLAEVLRDAGYCTAAVVSGGLLAPAYGLSQGFDLYDAVCCTPASTDPRNWCTDSRARAWLERGCRAPFFLFLHYWDVHAPYEPPAPYDTLFAPGTHGDSDAGGFSGNERGRMTAASARRDSCVALYDGEIAQTDRYLSKLFRELRELGLSENTLVVVTSDHGDEFQEHGGAGHGHTLFQELVHVPLIWACPGGAAHPRKVDEVVQSIDIAPTVLEFLGLEAPAQMEGSSFMRPLAGKRREPRPAFTELRKGNLKAVVLEESKLIRRGATQPASAYDLAADPGEQDPLPSQDLEYGSKLGELLEAFCVHEQEVSIEVRVTGASTRGMLVLEFRGPPLTGVCPWDLEGQDSLGLAPDSTTAVLKVDCPAGDIDGASLYLPSGSRPLEVTANLSGEPLDPSAITLGRKQHPRLVPFRIWCRDPRLLTAPTSRPASGSEGLHVQLWAVSGRSLPVARADLDTELQDALRALGYLQ
jgi:arylsulfatase A-like enzyme